MQIGSEKQYVVKQHLLEGLEQGRGEGIDIEDEAKEHHGRTMTTTKTTTTMPQQQENKKRQKTQKAQQTFEIYDTFFLKM
jgi:hypothetical protein